MFASGADKTVQKKIEEILARPEIQQEIEASVDAAVRAEIPTAVAKAVQTSLSEYGRPFRDSIKKYSDEWCVANADAIRTATEAAAAKIAQEPSAFEEVARRQFAYFLGTLAEKAVENAVARRDRRAKKAAKAKSQ